MNFCEKSAPKAPCKSQAETEEEKSSLTLTDILFYTKCSVCFAQSRNEEIGKRFPPMDLLLCAKCVFCNRHLVSERQRHKVKAIAKRKRVKRELPFPAFARYARGGASSHITSICQMLCLVV